MCIHMPDAHLAGVDTLPKTHFFTVIIGKTQHADSFQIYAIRNFTYCSSAKLLHWAHLKMLFRIHFAFNRLALYFLSFNRLALYFLR